MSLRLPFVLWTKIPKHDITAIAKTIDETVFVTGSMNGILCKWRANDSDDNRSNLIPQFLMIASSSSPVLSLCICVSHQRTFVVSVHNNSDINVWDLDDGSLFGSVPFNCVAIRTANHS
ncbi:uncharacterized protein MONOS_18023 [Monocercomonoides exilis]|uniref:uncharacterized protein n=1 Tax=Monocercomonoides exilis TaxID=2049356 RepID=UPI00355A590C|nr:hypothetical protein MONOS_18023 [Monocercomonoides exilis]